MDVGFNSDTNEFISLFKSFAVPQDTRESVLLSMLDTQHSGVSVPCGTVPLRRYWSKFGLKGIAVRASIDGSTAPIRRAVFHSYIFGNLSPLGRTVAAGLDTFQRSVA